MLAGACLIPGGAVLTRLGVDDILDAVALAVGLSFTIEAAGALAMVWTGWWHPVGWALALLVGSCALLMLDLRRVLATARSAI